MSNTTHINDRDLCEAWADCCRIFGDEIGDALLIKYVNKKHHVVYCTDVEYPHREAFLAALKKGGV